MTNEELRLIDRVQNGDISAFRSIMETHQEQIYYLAFDMSGNRQDAEDLSQEVFIKAFHAIKKFRREAKLSSWLFRIAMNTCIDKLRKKKMNPAFIHENLDELNNNSDDSFINNCIENPEHQTETSLIQNHINIALQKLSPRERSVFVLRHYNDLPIKEIADVLNLSIGTVKSLIFRSIKKLQEELAFYRHDLGLEKSK